MAEHNIWDAEGGVRDATTPLYIAVGGNTGSGKSTLLRLIAKEFARSYGCRFVPVDERNFHHPLLREMFRRPSKYALFVQTNFLLLRCTYLFRALDRGIPSVVERCHFEDKIFASDHFRVGNIARTDYLAYLTLCENLWSKLRAPDVYVRLHVEPDVSIQRIILDERSGKRPKEFPNEKTMREFVTRWHMSYRSFFNEVDETGLDGRFSGSLIVDVDAHKDAQENAKMILELVRQASL